jgi:hypothetical protein
MLEPQWLRSLLDIGSQAIADDEAGGVRSQVDDQVLPIDLDGEQRAIVGNSDRDLGAAEAVGY